MLSREGVPRRVTLLACCLFVGLLTPVWQPLALTQIETDLDRDEEVILFPATAHLRGSSWEATLDAWIFERRTGWDRVAAMKTFLKDRFQLPDLEMDRSSFFAARARMFFVDSERNQRISVLIGGNSHRLERSDAAGRITHRLDLGPTNPAGRTFEIQAVTQRGDTRVFRGTGHFIDADGLSVVSDIDDTIKHSDVLNRRELAANTFLRPFTEVPGMAEVYRRWAASGDVAFHYVSGSPRPLYPALAEWMSAAEYPSGTLTLRHFRWADRSATEFLQNMTLEYKTQAIEGLMAKSPGRQFVLVGDSGEKDPEVYAGIAARAPGQVRAILIRDLGQPERRAEILALFGGLPSTVTRQLFSDVKALADIAAH